MSTQISYLNDLLDKHSINEEEYDRRAAPLFKIGEMIQAVTNGDAAQLQTLIKANPSIDLSSVEEKNANVMHLAISAAIRGKGNAQIIETLARARVPVNTELNGYSPLLRICDSNPFANDVAVAQALIAAGANVNYAAKIATQQHYTPLAAAITRGRSAQLVKALLDGKANPNVEMATGPVLCHACIYDLNDIAQLLIKAGADVNCREKEQGASCIASAISNFNVELVRWLVEGGVDRNAPIMNNQRASAVDLAKQLAKLNPGDEKFQEIQRILA